MSKEMIVSASSHETKIAILEDDQVTELYFEREKGYTLAGSIYKGRVTRVLPGMQSAFVDIGLERDAFLYVSDFLEDTEEYDRIAATVEEKVIRMQEKGPASNSAAEAPESAAASAIPAAETEISTVPPSPQNPPADNSSRQGAPRPSEKDAQQRDAQQRDGQQRDAQQGDSQQRFSRRSRRRRPHHKGFPDSKYGNRQSSSAPAPNAAPGPREVSAPEPAADVPAETTIPIILPGESLAKYRNLPSAVLGRATVLGSGPESRRDSAARVDSQIPSAEVRPQPATESAPAYGVSEVVITEFESVASEEPAVMQPSMAEPPLSALHLHGDVSAPQETSPIVSPPAGMIHHRHIVEPIPEPHVRSAEPALDWREETAHDAQANAAQESDAQGNVAARAHASAVSPLPEVLESDATPFTVGSGVEFEDIAEAEEVDFSGDDEALSTSEESASAESGEIEDGSAAGNPAAAEGGNEGSPMPQRASVRERHRNPRYMRKGRWAARREAAPAGRVEPSGNRGSRPKEREAAAQPLIADMLKEGQEILVQIAKEPLGKKGARITSHIALPGRYLVYMPTVDHVGVSRKISSDEERQRLKRIILEHSKGIQGGFIVRTAGDGHSEEDLVQDIQYLSKLWAETKSQAERSSAPILLHHDLNLVLRVLRDQLSTDFSAVWVDNEQEYEKILSLVSKFQPALVNRVKLYSKDVPLFDELGIQEEINKALKPKVWLKSGGYIVINQTEALVAIDINTGKFVGKSNRLEDTIVKTNVEAIKEIVRQIRLRDLGGIIVIDFIDMDEKKNRQKVMSAMEEALRSDRSPSKLLAFNEFGLVAITRKRVRQSLERSLCQPCAYCTGSGLVKSITTVCYEILSEARKIAPELERKQITLRVNPEVGRALKARDNTILPEIEEMTRKPVIIRNDPSLHIEHFDFN